MPDRWHLVDTPAEQPRECAFSSLRPVEMFRRWLVAHNFSIFSGIQAVARKKASRTIFFSACLGNKVEQDNQEQYPKRKRKK
jgi:hypothetical protein